MSDLNLKADLLLVDGNSIINRAYFAMARNNHFTAPDGTPTGAVYTFLNMLFSYIDKLNPEEICVCFDSKGKTFRHEFYEDYKAGRAAMDDDLAIQIPIAKEGLDCLGYARAELPGYEADDLVASFCKKAESAGKKVFVLSGDRDLWQLISEQTTLVYPYTNKKGGGRELMTPEAFESALGFKPQQLLDYKALKGDSSDNIPGVKGIGEKTATQLIKDYGSLDAVYENIENIKGAQKKKLIEGKDSAYLSYKLAKLNFEAPIASSLTKNVYDELAWDAFLRKLNINSFRKRFGLDLEEEEEQARLEIDYQRISNYADFAVKGEEVILLPLESGDVALFNKDKDLYLLQEEDLPKLWQDLLLASENLIIWGLKDFSRAHDLPLEKAKFVDLEILAYLVNVGELSKGYPENILSVYQELSGQEQSFYPTEEISEAAKEEESVHRLAIYTYLREELLKRLGENKMNDLAFDLEFPLTIILGKMEQRGIKIDQAALERLSEMMAKEEASLNDEAQSYFPSEINLNSSKQLGEMLFKELGLRGAKKTKSGNYSTAADILEGIYNDHPVIPLILQYREVSKLRSTFVDGLAKELANDGRVHTHFNQTLTSTGRLSSTAPNLQNIPVKSDHAAAIRNLFIPQEGYVFLDADYSQIELRLLAVLSQDEVLLESYRKGEDIHRSTAARMFNKAPETISDLERRAAKTINFSIIYGISEFSLSQDLKVSRAEAAQYIASYHEHYPRVLPWMEEQVDFAKEHGYVETILGRRRYIPELKSKNFHQRRFGERAAMNAPVQGSAADLIKLAMVKVEQAFAEAQLQAYQILQVHDEILLEVKEEEMLEAARILKESMETAMDLSLPIKADVEIGKSWGEMRALEEI